MSLYETFGILLLSPSPEAACVSTFDFLRSANLSSACLCGQKCLSKPNSNPLAYLCAAKHITLHPFTEISSFQQLDSGTLLPQTQMDFYLSHFS